MDMAALLRDAVAGRTDALTFQPSASPVSGPASKLCPLHINARGAATISFDCVGCFKAGGPGGERFCRKHSVEGSEPVRAYDCRDCFKAGGPGGGAFCRTHFVEGSEPVSSFHCSDCFTAGGPGGGAFCGHRREDDERLIPRASCARCYFEGVGGRNLCEHVSTRSGRPLLRCFCPICSPEQHLAKNIMRAIARGLEAGNTHDSATLRKWLGFDTTEQMLASFKPKLRAGMTWSNHGCSSDGVRRWQFDHKLPLATFELSDPEDHRRAWLSENLMPEWDDDNRAKSDYLVLLHGRDPPLPDAMPAAWGGRLPPAYPRARIELGACNERTSYLPAGYTSAPRGRSFVMPPAEAVAADLTGAVRMRGASGAGPSVLPPQPPVFMTSTVRRAARRASPPRADQLRPRRRHRPRPP
jgi:hypothetical protein